jgi:hypothetical protein
MSKEFHKNINSPVMQQGDDSAHPITHLLDNFLLKLHSHSWHTGVMGVG